MFHPDFLWYLFILVPIILIMLVRFIKGRKDLLNLSGHWRAQSFYDLYIIKSFFISFGILIFIVFVIFALTGFSNKEVPENYEPKGVDIIFVTDISNSMNAKDVSPSRLKRASSIIRSICENFPNANYGLVAFKGQGVKIIPITEDAESIYLFLNFINSNIISTPGSNIQSGIETALSSFAQSVERRKYLILLSDGEFLTGKTSNTAEMIKNKGATIISIGIGTNAGASIQNPDNSYIKDNNGKNVVSKLNETFLRQIAELTGEEYFIFSEPLLLPKIVKIISGNDKNSQRKLKTTVKVKYRSFLIISLIGLFISVFVKRLKWKNYF